jgi:hypothetical protein
MKDSKIARRDSRGGLFGLGSVAHCDELGRPQRLAKWIIVSGAKVTLEAIVAQILKGLPEKLPPRRNPLLHP